MRLFETTKGITSDEERDISIQIRSMELPSLLEPKWTVAFEMGFLDLWTCRRAREASVVSMQVAPAVAVIGLPAAFDIGDDITNATSMYLRTSLPNFGTKHAFRLKPLLLSITFFALVIKPNPSALGIILQWKRTGRERPKSISSQAVRRS